MKEQKRDDVRANTDIIYESGCVSVVDANEWLTIICNCYKNKDCLSWIGLIYNDDEMTITAEKEWFDAYVLKASNLSLELSCREETGNIIINNKIQLIYDEYDTHCETHEYYLSYVESQNAWKIVKILKKRNPFPIEYEAPAEVDFQVLQNDMHPWWDNQSLIDLERHCTEPAAENIYLRSIARTVFYRGVHPIIECASIKLNMMSVYICELAKQLYHKEKLHYLANIYNAMKERFTVSIARSERNNEWSSKLCAPWYSFDELIALKLEDGKIVGSCSSYMSFFYAMLRLGGFGTGDLIQARFATQDILLVFIESDIYMICTDYIQKVTGKTFFYKKKITILYTDEWYWTERGETNIDKDTRMHVRKKFESIEKVFEFPFICKEHIRDDKIPSNFYLVNMKDSFQTIHNDAVWHNYYFSSSQPDGATTWAKYAYQSLIVRKPNVYIKWSVQCKMVREFIDSLESFNDVIDYLANLEPCSIFYDAYRLMTADQVIRSNRADDKAKAVFLYAVMNIKYHFKGAVIFTSKYSYCMWKTGAQTVIINMEDMQSKELMEGEVILAMNDNKAIYPLLVSQDINKSYMELVND